MRTLTGSLLAAQQAATGVPTVKVELKPRLGAVRKLSWTRLYEGTETPYYHACTVPGDGSLIRALILDGSPRTLYISRVEDPNYAPDFATWTYIADTSYAGCALASYGADVILIWTDTDQRTIRYRTSSDYGATWSSTQTLAAMPNAVYHLAAAMNADGDVFLIFFEWDTVYYYIRTSGSWCSKQTMPDTPCIVSGISAAPPQAGSDKWAVAITGRNTVNQRGVWTRHLYGSAWSTLAPLLLADNTALDYRAPSLTYDGISHRLSFVESSSSDVEYHRVYLTFHIPEAEGADDPPAYSFADNLWKEPYPIFTGNVIDWYYGLALCCSETFAYLTDPRAVYQASLDPTAVDLTARVLSLKQTINPPGDGNNAAVIEVDNTDGQLTDLMDTDVEISISPGYAGEYSESASGGPSLWISACELVSEPAKSKIVIYGQGPEALLERQVFRLQTIWQQAESSVLDLIAWTLARAGLALAVDSSSQLSQDLKPAFTIKPGDNALTVLKRLLAMIPDVLYQRGPTLVLTDLYPPATPYPYQLPSVAGTHPLYSGRYRTQTDALNWAQVWATVTPWLTYDVFAQEINLQYDRLDIVDDLNANTETLITDRAQAMIARPQRFRAEGEALIPTNCGLDLWDRVTITDARVAIDKTYRVIGCAMSYEPSAKSYRMLLRLGPDTSGEGDPE